MRSSCLRASIELLVGGKVVCCYDKYILHCCTLEYPYKCKSWGSKVADEHENRWENNQYEDGELFKVLKKTPGAASSADGVHVKWSKAPEQLLNGPLSPYYVVVFTCYYLCEISDYHTSKYQASFTPIIYLSTCKTKMCRINLWNHSSARNTVLALVKK